MTSPFNAPRDYSAFGGKVNDKHEGADFDVIGGSVDNKNPVLCVYDGLVVNVGFSSGYGNRVIIEHENNGSLFYTWYCHLDKVFVTQGTTLIPGSFVGEIGSTGNAQGEHIHFNLQVPGYGLDGYIVAEVVDPMPYF